MPGEPLWTQIFEKTSAEFINKIVFVILPAYMRVQRTQIKFNLNGIITITISTIIVIIILDINIFICIMIYYPIDQHNQNSDY